MPILHQGLPSLFALGLLSPALTSIYELPIQDLQPACHLILTLGHPVRLRDTARLFL